MKKTIFATFALLIVISLNSNANQKTLGEVILEHPAVVAIISLLNSANNESCSAPKPEDVHPFCLGALPAITEPTIVGNSCAFSLIVSCSNGASATISGENMSLEIMDQNHKVSNNTNIGIVIRQVVLTPSKN